ncbi:MAG: amidohydrolase family protein, partial [Desulfuromonadales bacterium]|nr:amidohydrolase family protein [Desulfuromonadales bacterium]
GYLRPGDIAIHGVQVDDEDIALLKQRGCHVVLCPRSNAQLGVGLPPVEKYLAAGMLPALGTDSLASAPSLSIWDEIAFAADKFGDKVPRSAWLRMATQGGAAALGLDKQIGALKEGYDASFQVVSLSQELSLKALPKRSALIDTLCAPHARPVVHCLYLKQHQVYLNQD